MEMMRLQVASDRKHLEHRTGVYVRAKEEGGEWGSHDIATLEPKSLLGWMSFKRGHNDTFPEQIVLVLLRALDETCKENEKLHQRLMKYE